MSGTSVRRYTLLSANAQILLGLALNAAPKPVSLHVYGALFPIVPVLPPALTASGVCLLLFLRYRLPAWAPRLLYPVAAAPPLALAVLLGHHGLWATALLHGGMALAVATAPWLAAQDAGDSGPQLWALTLGVIEAAMGAGLLLAPGTLPGVAAGLPVLLLRVIGAAGLAGGAALTWPEAGHGWFQPQGRGRRLTASLLPAALILAHSYFGNWPIALVWAVWILALLASRQHWAATLPEPPASESDTVPPLWMVQRSLHAWGWVLAVVVMALPALLPGRAVAPPPAVHLFLLAVSAYSVLAHWGFPGDGLAQRRILLHTLFLTVALGCLAAVTQGWENLRALILVFAPMVAVRGLRPAQSRLLLLVTLAAEAGSGLVNALHAPTPLSQALPGLVISPLVTGAVLALSLRLATATQRLLHHLAMVRSDLAQQVQMLQRIHAELQARSAELVSEHQAMESLAATASAIAGGDLTGRAAVPPGGALQLLARALNAMADGLEARILEREASRRRIIAAQEAVRRQVAEELHSTVQSTLLVLAHELERCRSLLHTDPASAAARLEKAAQQLHRLTEDEVRGLSHRLHPFIVRLGLAPSLSFLRDQFEGALEISLGIDPRLPPKLNVDHAGSEAVVLTAYRVMEETLANAVKHARATRVSIRARYCSPDWLVLTVTDNGAGFDPAAAPEGLGLSLMRDCVDALGGRIRFRGAPGRGTRVTLALPVRAGW